MGPAPQRAFHVIFTLLVALASACSLNAAEWRKLSTPRYTIITHASDRLTRHVASDFDDFLGFLDRFVVAKPEGLTPLTIVLFADDGEFDPYKPVTPEGVNVDYVPEELMEVWTTSMTGTQNGWTTIGAAAQDYGSPRQARQAEFQDYGYQTERGVLEGGVYWYLSALKTPAPPAVTRGMASMFGGFKREITHGVLGAINRDEMLILDQWPLIPVKQLLTMTEMEAVTGHNRVLFNVESRAFVQYLMFSKWSMDRHAFSTYWQALRDGYPSEEAMLKALGPDWETKVNTDLSAFIHSTRYLLRIEMGEEIENKDPIVPADAMEVEIALTKATMVSRHGQPVAHADAAVAASRGRPEAYDIRAEALAASKAAPADIAKAVDDALAHGSRSAWTAWKKADFRFSQIANPAASPKGARAVVNLAEQAANLDFRFRPSFNLMAQALAFSDRVTDDDAKFMAFARARFPWDRWILIGQSAIHAKTGDPEGARQLRERALSDDRTLDPRQLAEIKAFVARMGEGAPGSPAGGHPS
ncbi:MAG: hypothetical protein ABSA05_11885 [Opitutaceae bacterium]|jgi:hypothetical protein